MGAIWRQLLRSISKGLTIVSVVFLLYALINLFVGGGVPVLQRGPHVWLYYWPTVFWSHGDYPKDKDEGATFLINLLVYSVIAFVIARLKRRKEIRRALPT